MITHVRPARVARSLVSRVVGRNSIVNSTIPDTVNVSAETQCRAGALYDSTVSPTVEAECWFHFTNSITGPLTIYGNRLGLLMTTDEPNYDMGAVDVTYRLYLMVADWNPATLTWNNRPAVGASSYLELARASSGALARDHAAQLNKTLEIPSGITVYGLFGRLVGATQADVRFDSGPLDPNFASPISTLTATDFPLYILLRAQ